MSRSAADGLTTAVFKDVHDPGLKRAGNHVQELLLSGRTHWLQESDGMWSREQVLALSWEISFQSFVASIKAALCAVFSLGNAAGWTVSGHWVIFDLMLFNLLTFWSAEIRTWTGRDWTGLSWNRVSAGLISWLAPGFQASSQCRIIFDSLLQLKSLSSCSVLSVWPVLSSLSWVPDLFTSSWSFLDCGSSVCRWISNVGGVTETKEIPTSPSGSLTCYSCLHAHHHHPCRSDCVILLNYPDLSPI